MKALSYQKQTDRFTFQELAEPKLSSPHDVLVKVAAVGLNPVDAKINLWHAMVPDMRDDFVGGLDVSGEIVALGEAVSDWKVGDKVLYHGDMRRAHGGFAQYAVHDSRTLLAHPKLSPEQAAASPCAAWTAYRALVDKLRIGEGQNILITGGAGGVGSFALQLARYFKAKQVITSASAAKHDYVRSLGATAVIDYRNQDLQEEVKRLTNNQGVQLALDCVGGANEQHAAACLAFEGQLVELVQTVDPASYENAFLRGLSFHQLSLGSGHVNGEVGRTSIVTAGRAVNALLEQGELSLPKIELIELADIGEALIAMRQQKTTGKVVAKISL